jgi:hypothetical protein
MAHKIINKYIWIVDTIQRYGRITREDLNNLWVKSSLSEGEPMSRRSFYNYRQGIAETFNIQIESSPGSYEYYISSEGDDNASKLINLMLDSVAMSDMLSDSHSVSNRIILEDVPSARINLPTVMGALKSLNRITFTYHAHNRISAKDDVVIEPYCVRLFKQLWYVIGYNVKDKKIKTYSLDRISNLVVNSDTFVMPADFDGNAYFYYCFGVMTSQSKPKKVTLKASKNKAKYLRALPLHHTQKEISHEGSSLFTYDLCITNDLVAEILSFGSEVEVITPPELKTLVLVQLKNTLALYESQQ